MDYLINDEIKYFLYNNKFLQGKVTEILPHGSIIIKNNNTKLCHKVSADNVVLNITLLERKIVDQVMEQVMNQVNEINDQKISKLSQQYNWLSCYSYIITICIIYLLVIPLKCQI